MVRGGAARWPGTIRATLALVAGACGPTTVGDDVYPRNCGELGPVDLLDVPWGVDGALVVGEHVLIEALPSDLSHVDVMVVPRCGGEAVELAELELPTPSLLVGSAGGHVVRCEVETGAVDWLDPDGRLASHRLFDATWGCRLYAVAGGLAALDPRDDTILWVADPIDAREPARVVAPGAHFVEQGPGEFPQCAPRFDDCPLGLSLNPRLGPEVAGDVLLVPTLDRALVEVDVRTGSVSAPLATDVRQLEVLPDPRYVRWHDQAGGEHLLDRRTSASTRIGQAFASETAFDATDRWLVRTQVSPNVVPAPEEPWTVLWARHLPTGRDYEITGRDGWRFVGALGDDRLVVDIEPLGPDERARYIVTPATGELVPIDAPSQAVSLGEDLLLYDEGPNGDLVTLRLLTARDQVLETLDEAARRDFVATTHRRVTYVDGPALDMVGTLRARTPDGSWFELDEDDVSHILWPEATLTPSPVPTDAREIVYLALTRDRRVVRRTVLP